MGRPSKLSDSSWSRLERLALEGESQSDLARDFKVSKATVSKRLKLVKPQDDQAPVRASRASKDAGAGFVYVIFIDAGGERFFKIGSSGDLMKRVATHQCSSPFEVSVALSYFVRDMAAEERHHHQCFAAKKIRGEWFKLDCEDLQRIAARALLLKA